MQKYPTEFQHKFAPTSLRLIRIILLSKEFVVIRLDEFPCWECVKFRKALDVWKLVSAKVRGFNPSTNFIFLFERFFQGDVVSCHVNFTAFFLSFMRGWMVALKAWPQLRNQYCSYVIVSRSAQCFLHRCVWHKINSSLHFFLYLIKRSRSGVLNFFPVKYPQAIKQSTRNPANCLWNSLAYSYRLAG